MPKPSRELMRTLLAKCEPTPEERDRARECGGRRKVAIVQLCLARLGYLRARAHDGRWDARTATAAAEFLRDCLASQAEGPGGRPVPAPRDGTPPRPGEGPAPPGDGTPTAPPDPCGNPRALMRGVDVSHWQPEIDFRRVRAAGYCFVYIKATQGRDIADERAAMHAQRAKEAGLWIGYYPFATPGTHDGRTRADDVADEWRFFLDTIADLSPDDLVPALDLEENPVGLTDAELTRWAEAWLAPVGASVSKKPLAYTSPSFADRFEPPTTLGDNPPWIAHHGVATPRVPAIWSGRYVLHQTTKEGRVDGIRGNVDIDVAPNGIAGILLR